MKRKHSRVREADKRKIAMARLKVIAGNMPDQEGLDLLLAGIEDSKQRKAMFDTVKPFLRFDAVYTFDQAFNLTCEGR